MIHYFAGTLIGSIITIVFFFYLLRAYINETKFTIRASILLYLIINFFTIPLFYVIFLGKV